MTVCTPTVEIAGVQDVTASLPRLIGGQGILDTYQISLNDEEYMALNKSASIIREALDSILVGPSAMSPFAK